MAATALPVAVKNIECSVSPASIVLLTQQLRYPRMVHADFMTHRVFSRNGRSSRAVPIITMMEEAKNPYVPQFCSNQRGMQAGEPLDADTFERAEQVWRFMADICRRGVEELQRLNVHKQWANRPLEWFGYIDVLVTSVFWGNFDALRDDPAAQPEIQELARLMKQERLLSQPRLLQPGEWHLPYVAEDEITHYGGRTDPTGLLRKLSTARCARLTIRPFDGDGSIEKEIARHDGLVVSRPVHASPAEHQGTPDETLGFPLQETGRSWAKPKEHGNFVGWRQYRKTIPHEAVMESFPALEAGITRSAA